MSQFEDDTTLEDLEDTLVWLEARLLSDPDASDLAASVSALLSRVDEVRAADRDTARDMLRADARVDAADAALDEHVEALATWLRQTSDPDGNRFRRYFQRGAEHVIRLGLASQLEVVRRWPALLAEDPDPMIAAGAEPIAAAISTGDGAVAFRTASAIRQAEIRTTRVIPLVEDANAMLAALADDLTERGKDRPGWAERFRIG